jgi:hypothetical protein
MLKDYFIRKGSRIATQASWGAGSFKASPLQPYPEIMIREVIWYVCLHE